MAVSIKWSQEEEHLLKLMRATHSNVEIAEIFKRRVDLGAVGFPGERTTEAIRKKCERDGITADTCINYTTEKNPIRDQWKRIRALSKKYEAESLVYDTGIIELEDITTKILAVSDLHFPLTRVNSLYDVLTTHQDADVCVVNGDLVEGYLFSTFEKDKRIAALDEYRGVFEIIEWIARHFPKVVLIEGNHDVRVGKALQRAGMFPDSSQLLRSNIIASIANGERLDDVGMLVEKLDFKNVHYQLRDPWYFQVGQTIFVHPSSKGSGKPGYTVQRVHDTVFKPMYNTEDYDSVVCGHTHKTYKGVLDRKLLIEQGSFCGLLEYAHKPNLRYTSGSTNGFAIIYQDAEGNTDFNRSGPIYLGEVCPPKKRGL